MRRWAGTRRRGPSYATEFPPSQRKAAASHPNLAAVSTAYLPSPRVTHCVNHAKWWHARPKCCPPGQHQGMRSRVGTTGPSPSAQPTPRKRKESCHARSALGTWVAPLIFPECAAVDVGFPIHFQCSARFDAAHTSKVSLQGSTKEWWACGR